MSSRDEEWLLEAFADLRAQDRPEVPAGLVARILADADQVQNARRAGRKRPVWRRWWEACKTRGSGLVALPSAVAAAGFFAVFTLPSMQAQDAELIEVAVFAVELEEAETTLGSDEMIWLAGWPAGIIDNDGETTF